MMRSALSSAIAIGATMAMVGSGNAADPRTIEWSRIPSQSAALFYPGQSTMDWLFGTDHKGASRQLRVPHVSPATGAARRPLATRWSRAATLSQRRSWKERRHRSRRAGCARCRVRLFPFPMEDEREPRGTHARLHAFRRETMEVVRQASQRQDGPVWRTAAALRGSVLDHAGRRRVPEFAQHGCWLTCHDGMRDTRNAAVGDPVKKHPLFGEAA